MEETQKEVLTSSNNSEMDLSMDLEANTLEESPPEERQKK